MAITKNRFLLSVWNGWLKFGKILGKINTTIILSIVYFIAVSPTGFIKKFFVPKNPKNTYWVDLPEQKHSLEKSYKQY